MAIQNVLSTAVSGLLAQSFRASEIAHNIANVNTPGFKSVDIQTISIEAGAGGSGVLARRQGSDAGESGGDSSGGDLDLARQFTQLIETEIAYTANAQVLRTTAETLGRVVDLVG
jgi:flagellar basal-body rod protein FlgC